MKKNKKELQKEKLMIVLDVFLTIPFVFFSGFMVYILSIVNHELNSPLSLVLLVFSFATFLIFGNWY